MFVNSLYSINSTEFSPETLVAGITIDQNHSIFTGHFPGAPVTPGVVQVQIVKEIMESQLGKKLVMKSMRTCKFLEVLNPVEDPSVRINIKYKQLEMLEVTASGESHGKVFFKMQASYL